MATAHLIHGFLCVGKTTLARELEQTIPAVRFSHSEWMAKLYGDDPPIEKFAHFHRLVYEQIEEIWTKCLQLGVDVVLDFGCWTRQERDALRSKIATIGAQARLYWVTCSEEGVWRRVEERNIDPNSPFISNETFEVLKQCYEPLNEDEERVEVVASDTKAWPTIVNPKSRENFPQPGTSLRAPH
jgi:predicted kinase